MGGDLLDIRKKVVGITGAKRAGKDTVADYLRDVYGFRRLAFAEPIKDALAAAFGVDVAIFHDQSVKEKPLGCLLGHTPRRLMQTLGTGWGREMISDSLWRNLLYQKASEALSGGSSVVVSDVRYDNEAQTVKDLGGHIIEVRRPSADNSGDTHSSEGGIGSDFIDFRILNSRGFEALYAQVGVILGNIDQQAVRAHRPDRAPAL